MALKVLHSFVHAGKNKVTSLTVSLAEDSVIITMSDKVNKIRIKMNPNELAGLAKAINKSVAWSAFHSFSKDGKTTETRINYNDSFFNVDNGKKIALKLTNDELAAFEMVLKIAFETILQGKIMK